MSRLFSRSEDDPQGDSGKQGALPQGKPPILASAGERMAAQGQRDYRSSFEPQWSESSVADRHLWLKSAEASRSDVPPPQSRSSSLVPASPEPSERLVAPSIVDSPARVQSAGINGDARPVRRRGIGWPAGVWALSLILLIGSAAPVLIEPVRRQLRSAGVGIAPEPAKPATTQDTGQASLPVAASRQTVTGLIAAAPGPFAPPEEDRASAGAKAVTGTTAPGSGGGLSLPSAAAPDPVEYADPLAKALERPPYTLPAVALAASATKQRSATGRAELRRRAAPGRKAAKANVRSATTAAEKQHVATLRREAALPARPAPVASPGNRCSEASQALSLCSSQSR
ncbi:MAG: hypothetical protein JWQ23_445 [Herminiimonas sp.]|nr:hypothetical protein [Herminiimonas sp.]